MNLPFAFCERMKRLLGEEYDAFLAELNREESVKGLRVNTHKLSIEAFLASTPFPLVPLSFVPEGFVVDPSVRAGKHPYHHAGAYYLQDPGAMSSVASIPRSFFERNGLRILDLCAAPGGKTTQLAALCERDGVVLANEYVSSRSRILSGNVERMGLDNVIVTNTDSACLARLYPDTFDLVVVDAPCSGEGMYRKNALAVSEWSEENVRMCAARQEEILENAMRCVAPDGLLLYSTCTYSVEENEGVLENFLKKHSDFHLIPVSDQVIAHTSSGLTRDACPFDLSPARRFYPHRSPGEGQFAALLKRDGQACTNSRTIDAAVELTREEARVAEAFFKETVGYVPEGLVRCGSTVALRPFGVSLPLPSFAVSVGVMIGEVRKGRMLPHHHFFMAFGRECRSRLVLTLDDSRLAKYLAGEEIEVPNTLSGFTAVLLSCGDEELTLGGGKSVGGRLKNYYPKGLRTP